MDKELQAVAEAMHNALGYKQPLNHCTKEYINEMYKMASASIAAMRVREMSVEEAEEYIYAETRRFTETSALLALAKLGTIRITGGGE